MSTTENTRRFVQLPNGDLWRGYTPGAERTDNVDASAPATPEDAVMEMIAATKGEVVSCQWCGEQFSRKQLNEIREHVETRHASALKPVSDLAALAALAIDHVDISKITPSAVIAAPKLD